MKRGLLFLGMCLLLTSACTSYTHKRSLLTYDYPVHASPAYTPPVFHDPFFGEWPYASPFLSPYHPYFYP